METGNSQNKSHQTEAGGSTPPQAREQQPVAQRGVKSSDAVEANTPAGGGRSRFTSIAGRVARTELPTGGALLALENRATPIVAIRASLRAGSYFEPRDKPGLARLTAEMLERGTGRRTKLQIAGELEAVGAELEFSADTFALQVSGRTLAKDFPRYLETLAEILREPSLPGEELHKLKQQTVALIQEQQANTRFRAYEKLTQVIFDPANPFFVPPGEQLVNSINSITVEDVREFYQRRYGGRSLILAVSGDVEASDVQTRFADAFENFAGPESVDINVAGPAPQSEARREIVVLKEKASVDVMLGCAAPLRRDASDYYAALLANSALGESTLSSRLGLEVRDREGLTYGIGSRFRAPSLAAGPWYVAVSVNPQNVERAIESA
ncbi:MAG TPA: pitrilysin family protein, partial [Pyrinomonadaceae bacterium]|nr:pitrilysin family protein [Pyrinomonadaceae bacterium]